MPKNPLTVRRIQQVCLCVGAASALVAFLWMVHPPNHNAFWDATFDTGHVLIFGLVAILGIKLAEAILPAAGRWVHYCIGAGGSLAIGIAIEVLQLFVPLRTFEVIDLFNDLVGVLAFAMLYAAVDRRVQPSSIRGLRPTVLVAAASTLIFVGLIPLMLICGNYQMRNAQFPVLLQFSAPWYESFVVSRRANLKAVPPPREWPAGSRRRVARVDCTPGQYPGLSLADPYPDWTGYDTLEIDILVPKFRSEVFVLRVDDRDHNNEHADRFNGICQVVPGFQTLRFDLRDIQTGPRFRELDMSNIARAMLFIVELDEPFTFYVGEMRLRGSDAQANAQRYAPTRKSRVAER